MNLFLFSQFPNTFIAYGAFLLVYLGLLFQPVVACNTPPVNVVNQGNLYLCPGQTTSLVADSGFVNYQWNTGYSGRNLTVSQHGSYQVTVTDGNGCTGTSSIIVVSTPSLVPSSNSPVCEGNAIVLSANSIFGAGYSWTGPNGFSQNTFSPSLPNATLLMGGVYTVTATLPGCQASISTTTSVNIHSNPLLLNLISSAPVCLGGNLQLSLSGNFTGVTALWQGPDGYSVNGQSITRGSVTSLMGGVYSVHISSPGCSSLSRTISVAVLDTTVSATSSGTLCEGRPVYFSGTGPFGSSYQWTGPNQFSSSLRNPFINASTPQASGIYTLSVSHPVCGTRVAHTSLQVDRQVTGLSRGSNTPVCIGTSLLLTATVRSGLAYIWYGPGGFSASGDSVARSGMGFSEAGSYTLIVSNAGCGTAQYTTGVSIQDTQVVITPVSPVCTGSAVYLSSTGSPALQWSGPNGYTFSGRSTSLSNVQPVQSGLYVAMDSNKCGVFSDTLNLVIGQSLNSFRVTTNSPVCQGLNLTLNMSPSLIGSGTISWSGPRGFLGSTASVSVANLTQADNGQYSLTVSTPGCGTRVVSAGVQINSSIVTAQVNSPVCSGVPVYFSSSSHTGATYAWSGPSGFSSTRQSPSINQAASIHSGVYNLAVTIPGCGLINRQVTVSVQQRPTVNPVTNSPVCQGNVLQMNQTSVSGVSYSWAGPNGFTAAGVSISRSNANSTYAGLYTISATTLACGSVSKSFSVVVGADVQGVVVSSNSPICVGSAIQLSATAVSGAVYAWTGPASFNASGTSASRFSVTSNQAGAYSVTISTPGCVSQVKTTQVVVNTPPVPAVGSNSPVCQGNVLNLTTAVQTGVNYSWSGPLGFTGSGSLIAIASVQPDRSGIYTVSATISGCPSVIQSTPVSIGISPTGVSAGSNSPVCTGSALTLTATTLSGGSYSWSGPSGFTSSTRLNTLNSVTTGANGVYTLTVNTPGCVPAVRTITAVVNSPALVSPGSNGAVCTGNNLNLTTTSNSNTSYLWSGPNSFTSISQNPTISGISSLQGGVYTVTATSSGCSPVTGTHSVTVGASQSAVSANSNSPICVGSTLNLSLAAIGNGTYLWEGPNAYQASGASVSIPAATTAESGQYTLTATAPGCPSVIRLLSVIVNSLPIFSPGSNSPVCAGGSVQFSTSNNINTTYLWNGPNGFSSSVQNPSLSGVLSSQSGIYSLTASTTGCTPVTGTTTLVVGVSQSAIALTTNSPVCAGGTLELSVVQTGNGSYLWAGPSGYTNTGNSISLSPVSSAQAGQYTLTATAPGCNAVIRQNTVVINETPLAQPGSNSTICAGNVLSLTSATQSSASYLWQGPSGYSSNLQNPSRTNAQQAMSGVYSLTVTVTGCGSATGTHSVVISPSVSSATTTITSPICEGATLGLSVTAYTGVTYSWTGPGGFTSANAVVSIPNAQSANAGVYSLTISSPGCPSFSGTRTAVIQSPASVTASVGSPVCRGNAVYFTGNAPTGSTYRWDGPNGYSSALQNPSLTNVQLNQAGDYTLTATTTACGAISKVASLVVNSCREGRVLTVSEWADSESEIQSGDSEPNSEFTAQNLPGVQIFPLPFSTELQWSVQSDFPIRRIQLLDARGRLVLQELNPSNYGLLPTFNLSSGVYFFRLETDASTQTIRVIRE
jgi:hypothetical protein